MRHVQSVRACCAKSLPLGVRSVTRCALLRSCGWPVIRARAHVARRRQLLLLLRSWAARNTGSGHELREVDVRARRLVVMLKHRLTAAEHKRAALLQALLQLGGDPRLRASVRVQVRGLPAFISPSAPSSMRVFAAMHCTAMRCCTSGNAAPSSAA